MCSLYDQISIKFHFYSIPQKSNFCDRDFDVNKNITIEELYIIIHDSEGINPFITRHKIIFNGQKIVNLKKKLHEYNIINNSNLYFIIDHPITFNIQSIFGHNQVFGLNNNDIDDIQNNNLATVLFKKIFDENYFNTVEFTNPIGRDKKSNLIDDHKIWFHDQIYLKIKIDEILYPIRIYKVSYLVDISNNHVLKYKYDVGMSDMEYFKNICKKLTIEKMEQIKNIDIKIIKRYVVQ